MASERRHTLFALATAALAWLAGLGIELIARFSNLAYLGLGADLPEVTVVARDMVRDYHAAWAFAGVATALLGVLWLGGSTCLARGAAVLTFLVALEMIAAAIAFALPAVKACQDYALPSWNPPRGCTGDTPLPR